MSNYEDHVRSLEPSPEMFAASEMHSRSMAYALGAASLSPEKDMPPELFINEGAQTWVYQDPRDPSQVKKFSKFLADIINTVESWGPSDEEDLYYTARRLAEQRDRFIDRLIYDAIRLEYSPAYKRVLWCGSIPNDLLGHSAFIPYREDAIGIYNLIHTVTSDNPEDRETVYLQKGPLGVIHQPRAKRTMGEFLATATPEEAAERFRFHSDFTRRGMWFGIAELTHKFATNFGDLGTEEAIWGNPNLLIDPGEMTGSAVHAYTNIITQHWRHVFNGIDAPSIPKQHLASYYKHMDEQLTEDVFHALWDGHHQRRLNNQPESRNRHPKRSPAVLHNAFDHPAWRGFQETVLYDPTHPKAFVMKLANPIDPQNIFYEKRYHDLPPAPYTGLIAYYRRVESNPLFDTAEQPPRYPSSDELPMWYWSLQFVDQQTIDAFLEGKTSPLQSAAGIELQLREYDYSLYAAKFPTVSQNKLERVLQIVDSKGLLISLCRSNMYNPDLDQTMTTLFKSNTIKRHRVVEGFPYHGIVQPEFIENYVHPRC